MHGKLQIHELLHVGLQVLRMLFHQLLQSFSLHEFNDNSPLSVDLRHFQDLRDVQAAFFHAGLAESFVEHIRLAVFLRKHLDDTVAVFINNFIGTRQKYFLVLQIHNVYPPFLLIWTLFHSKL